VRQQGRASVDSAVEVARARFRPIVMTSFAFILGVALLVVAGGAGASARKSIGNCGIHRMIASTCLEVLFVPSFFVVVQRLEEWRGRPQARPGERRAGAGAASAGRARAARIIMDL
jgi:HAE1 family hydrophobic/amphiphilic exporter-1